MEYEIIQIWTAIMVFVMVFSFIVNMENKVNNEGSWYMLIAFGPAVGRVFGWF